MPFPANPQALIGLLGAAPGTGVPLGDVPAHVWRRRQGALQGTGTTTSDATASQRELRTGAPGARAGAEREQQPVGSSALSIPPIQLGRINLNGGRKVDGDAFASKWRERVNARAGAPPRIYTPQVQTPTLAEAQQQVPNFMAQTDAQMEFDSGPEPNFMRRPEGEAEIEDFAWRRMVSMGNYAPEALQEAWANIQVAKNQRLQKRADYAARMSLLKTRSDLDRRNQADRLTAQGTRTALDRLSNIRMAQVDAQLAAQDQRAQLYRQNRALAEKEADIAMKLGMPGAGVDRERLGKAATKHVPAFNDAVSMLNTLTDMERVYNSSDLRGTGVMATITSAFTRLFGGSDLTMARNQAELQLKRIAATEAARSFDSGPEGDRLAKTIPGLESEPREFMKWLNDTQRYMTKVAQAASDELDIAGHPALTRTLLQDSLPQLKELEKSTMRSGAMAAQ